MKISLGEKAQRVLKMMIGIRNARVATAMAAYGFTHTDLQEGWQLLRGVTSVKLDASPFASAGSDTLTKLDTWENKWFPIAEATVERRFPAVHAQLFKNLSQTSGPGVAVSVRTFIERFDLMAAGTGTYGAEGPAARAVLEARGLTDAVVNEARGLLETVSTVDTTRDVRTVEQDKAQLAKAETELWAWYLEWSQIARVAVTQRVLLKQMGLVSTPRPGGDEEEEVDPVTGIVTPVPPPSVTA